MPANKIGNQSGISYIMPAYNCSKTVVESLNSILSTNITKNDEIVIVNDGSTDDTRRVLRSFKRKHANIEINIVDHQFNKGGGAARNTAVENSKNELIFCLDSDNILEDHSVDKLKKHLLLEGADIAAFQKLAYFTKNTTKITHHWTFSTTKDYDLAEILSNHENPGASGNYLYTKSSWLRAGRYPEEAGALDAWGFGVRQAAGGAKVAILQGSYYYHRYGHDSYWMRDSKKNYSLLGLIILIPYIDLIIDSDVDYIFSKRGRKTWYQNLDKRPIGIKVSTENILATRRVKDKLKEIFKK